jgi:hypothetical protein
VLCETIPISYPRQTRPHRRCALRPSRPPGEEHQGGVDVALGDGSLGMAGLELDVDGWVAVSSRVGQRRVSHHGRNGFSIDARLKTGRMKSRESLDGSSGVPSWGEEDEIVIRSVSSLVPLFFIRRPGVRSELQRLLSLVGARAATAAANDASCPPIGPSGDSSQSVLS